MELKGKIINVLGDSITEGVGTSAKDKRFPDVLKELSGAELVRNYGWSGTRIARHSEDTNKSSFVERFGTMDDNADLVLVFGGTNDYGHGDATLGAMSDRIDNTFYGALHLLYSGLIKKYPTARIVIMTPTHRANENNGSSNGLPLVAYVNAIREVADYYSLPIIDMYKNGGICPDIAEQREAFCPDGLHPNDAGNRRIAEYLNASLKAL